MIDFLGNTELAIIVIPMRLGDKYELELACVIGKSARDLPDDDSALDVVAGFTIMNDW
jgi:2-keto-4-pentenoate hydratase/2-oxohepta-3-ene-1,7-dioic acid hydratase in catechol pathway